MENVIWEKLDKNDLGIQAIAFKDLGRIIPNVGKIVGYNGILQGDTVKYEGRNYTVVMVSRLGDFGLSETGKLPYIMRVLPSKVEKV